LLRRSQRRARSGGPAALAGLATDEIEGLAKVTLTH
jgi:hypothetical protein